MARAALGDAGRRCRLEQAHGLSDQRSFVVIGVRVVVVLFCVAVFLVVDLLVC